MTMRHAAGGAGQIDEPPATPTDPPTEERSPYDPEAQRAPGAEGQTVPYQAPNERDVDPDVEERRQA